MNPASDSEHSNFFDSDESCSYIYETELDKDEEFLRVKSSGEKCTEEIIESLLAVQLSLVALPKSIYVRVSQTISALESR